MKLEVIGCSPAWHNPGGAESGYLVEGEEKLLLDCGPGVFAALRKRDGWPCVDAIAITHFHLDHWGDLVPWTFGAAFGPGRGTPPPELWLPPGGIDVLRSFTSKLNADPLFTVFSVREYEEGISFRAAGFTVLPARVLHYDLDAFGFRVSDGTRTLAYSGTLDRHPLSPRSPAASTSSSARRRSPTPNRIYAGTSPRRKPSRPIERPAPNGC